MKKAQALSYSQALDILRAHPAVQTPDIQACFKPSSQHFYSETMHAWAIEKGLDIAHMFKLPQKQVKRFTQFLGVMVTGEVTKIDSSHARIVCAMHLAGSYKLTTDAIITLAAGKRSGDVNTRGVSVSAINRIFAKSQSIETVKAKVSNSTGKNGFFQMLGMTYAEPSKRNHEVTLIDSHPFTLRFLELINTASAAQIDAMMGDE